MRLDAHPARAGHRPLPAEQGARLPPFFAGMTRAARSALDSALEEGGGLILVAGPAGSGRSTTLRSLLRVRPDAIAIGGIGSAERAAAALRAARGRLVLATVDSRDSIAALGRIAAFDVERSAIACVLRLVLAQRLVRRLCPSCRTPVQPPNEITAPLGLEPGTVVYEARGCGGCRGQGFAGPIGAFETMPVDSNVGRMIVCGADEAAIANQVFRTSPNLSAAVRALVTRGLTSAEEGIAVLRPGHSVMPDLIRHP
jgi:general secretion pathway protein E